MTETQASQPDDDGPIPDYYQMLLASCAKAYSDAALRFKQIGDDKKELFYAGKRDAMCEAFDHYLELKKK